MPNAMTRITICRGTFSGRFEPIATRLPCRRWAAPRFRSVTCQILASGFDSSAVKTSDSPRLQGRAQVFDLGIVVACVNTRNRADQSWAQTNFPKQPGRRDP